MKPGKELDALIAEKVMDNHIMRQTVINGELSYRVYSFVGEDGLYEIPSYSTDIAAAWEVVEKMLSLGFFYTVHGQEKEQYASFLEEGPTKRFPKPSMTKDSVAHAICLAAIKAKGITI